MALYNQLEECLAEVAKNYDSLLEFRLNDEQAFRHAEAQGILKKITAHMGPKNQLRKIPVNKGYWTKEKCADEARNHQSRRSFRQTCPSGYEIARRNGWLHEICSHMEYGKNYQRKEYTGKTDEQLKELCLPYDCKPTFSKLAITLVCELKRRGLYDAYTAHMSDTPSPEGNSQKTSRTRYQPVLKVQTALSKKECAAIAKTFNGRNEWRIGHYRSYRIAKQNGWLDQCCKRKKRSRKAKKG